MPGATGRCSCQFDVVYGAGWADKITGETVEADASGFGYTLREPLVSWRVQAPTSSLLRAAIALMCLA